MPTVRRLTDSCLLVTTDAGTTLFDPGFHTFETNEIDLETIGDVQRVLITHEHSDHVNEPFVRWLLDRYPDVTVYSNDRVRDLLAPHDIEVHTDPPEGVTAQDVLHETLPNGTRPPNRCWTIAGVFTHPGDSYQLSETAPVLALPLIAPWGSITQGVAFAKRVAPRQAIPVHDFYMSRFGRERIMAIADLGFHDTGIELVKIDWGESYTF